MKKITVTDPEAQSADLVAANIAQLKTLFPELITEGADGAAVNVDVLKQLVGDATVSDADEKYGLNWHGKRRARQLALTPSTGTLRPCPEDSVDWDTTQNLMIEGDNLEVLKLLQKSYAGKVKLIYIDPPYNTGKDFVYPDDFRDGVRNYLELTEQAEGNQKCSSNTEASGRFHTDWVSMIYPRLILARQLLARDGLIAVSIDHNEVSNLRHILADVFGEENFVNQLAWVNNLKGRQIGGRGAVLTHEFILVFAKEISNISPFSAGVEWLKANMPTAYRGFNYEVLSDAKGEYVIKNQLYNTNSAFNEETRPNLVYDIHYNPQTGEVRTSEVGESRFEGFVVISPHRCNDGRHKFHAWRWGRSKVEQESDDLAFVEAHDGYRVFTKVRGYSTTSLKDLITDIATNEGERDVERLFDKSPFSYPKPVRLMRAIIDSFGVGEDDLVLDFFAGSGTLGHALMEQNAEDGERRQFILVQLPEPLDAENKDQKSAAVLCDQMGRPRNIAELTKERLRRAGVKVKRDNPEWKGDAGFRVFKLDHSNIRAWQPSGDLESDLVDSIEHILPDRSEHDVLTELLLKLGLDLCIPIEQRRIAGKTVHAIGAGVLMACLDTRITPDEVEALALGIAEWHAELAPAGDTTCVFRDSAFTNDEAKTNLALTLEQHGIRHVRSL